MPLVFPRDAYVMFNGFRISDHNRSPVDQSLERIESTVRTARGRLRKNYITDKWSFSMSWSELPEHDSATVDGFWGARSITQFYRDTPGEFELLIDHSDGAKELFTVHFTDFSSSLVYRYQRYYFNISLSLEEI